jgi:hypothetical protein
VGFVTMFFQEIAGLGKSDCTIRSLPIADGSSAAAC